MRVELIEFIDRRIGGGEEEEGFKVTQSSAWHNKMDSGAIYRDGEHPRRPDS